MSPSTKGMMKVSEILCNIETNFIDNMNVCS